MAGRFVDPLSPNLRAEGNFPARFSERKSIGFPKPYGLTSSFFVYVFLGTVCHARGCMVGSGWAESPTQI